jgi:glycosyltransferase involved in cell wall biosynthesis
LNAARLVMQARIARREGVAAGMLARAISFSETAFLYRYISARIRRRFPFESCRELWCRVVADFPRYRAILASEPEISRSIVLKAPGPGGERGVLVLMFEYNWARLALGLSHSDFEWFDKNFDFVLSTSWSPTDYGAIAVFLAKTKGPVFVHPCHRGEAERLAQFHPRVQVLDGLPCDWINPDNYGTNVGGRPIDFLMVANWGEFKRHWDFFMALRKLPKDLRVVLVGQKEGGRDAGFIRSLAAEIGVPQTLEIHQSLQIEEVAALQSQTKVSVIFSRREGCCVAAVESLFAGCALGMRADAHVGPLDYINERTGLRLRPGHLAEDLQKLLEISPTLDPAGWARENISCFITHEKLNRQLADSARARGLPWTQDLAIPHWRPYPRYVHPEDAEAMRPVYDDLHARFPKVFPEFETLIPD